MSNKNNTPEQKAQWEASKKLGSSFIKVIPSYRYKPVKKAPSRRDKRRAYNRK